MYNAENAVYAGFGAKLTVEGCTITGGSCLVQNGYGIAGAGISVPMGECEVTVTGSNVTGGSTDDSWIGSGIDVPRNAEGSTVKVEGSVIATGSGAGDSSTTYAIETGTPISVELKDTTLKANADNGNAVSPATGSVTAEGTLTVEGGALNTEVFTNGGVTVSGDDTVAPQMIAAKIGNAKYATLQAAADAASQGDIIVVQPGTYDEAVTLSKEGVSLVGAVDENGAPNVTVTQSMKVSGKNITVKNIALDVAYSNGKVIDGSSSKNALYENIAIDGHSNRYGIYQLADGTVLNSTINNCFMGIYSESNANATIDGLKSEDCVYGVQLVAYGADNIITIKNSEIDCSWANSIGSYGNGKNAKLVAENNIFKATEPYYGEDSKAYGINTFLPNSKITDNVFDEKSAILVREDAGADNGENLDLTKNYFAAGPAEALVNETSNVTVSNVFPVYVDAAKTTLSNVNLIDTASVGNLSVGVQNMNEIVPASELTSNSKYAVKAVNTAPAVPVSAGENKQVSYVDISFMKNGETITPSSPMNVFITINVPVESASLKHWNGSAWEDVSATLTGNILSFTSSVFSPFAIVYSSMPVTDPATDIAVELEKVTDAEYNIVLTSDKTINRFMSAELAFNYVPTTGSIAYEIQGVGNINVIDPEASGKEAYEFNLNGTEADVIGTRLTIGKVLFTGYGKGSFNIKGTDINFVNTAEIADNIVTHYVVGGGTDVGSLTLPALATDNIEISVPRQNLTVNVTFNNTITDNEKAYQDMKAVISGGDLTGDITVNFGTDETALVGDTYTFTQALTQNVAYTVTISGAGYRTARHTVTMTTDKTLNFWNNVKDTAEEIETGKGAKKANFLAGDIVKDNNINIYDLSAVVSYFGTDNLVSEHPEYAKYDLNRDGKIDSKDVAYVLVSWGN